MELIKNIFYPTKLELFVNSFIGSTFLIYMYVRNFISEIITYDIKTVDNLEMLEFYKNISDINLLLIIISMILLALIIAVAGYLLASIIYNIIKIISKKAFKMV